MSAEFDFKAYLGKAKERVEAALDGSLGPERPESLREAMRYSPVSYTHLRAHETSLHLVCRLLLFPSDLRHRVLPYEGSGPRYSVSYDLAITTAPGKGREMRTPHPMDWVPLGS